MVFETAARIKERFPDIEVITRAYDATFGLGREGGEAIDIWVPLPPHFDGNAAQIAAARAAGRDIWWYMCIGPRNPHANWFVEYGAIQPRLLMGAMSARYQPGGFTSSRETHHRAAAPSLADTGPPVWQRETV